MAVEKNALLNYLRNFNPDFDEVKRLVSEGADINAQDENGRTPLIKLGKQISNYLEKDEKRVEIELNKVNIAMFLLDNGANIKIKDSYGYTPLSYFVGSDNCFPIVKRIIETGLIDINEMNADGRSSVFLEAVNNYSLSKNVSVIKYLIESGADVYNKMPLKNIVSKEYFNPKSSLEEMMNLIQLFTNKGFNINTQDENGNSCLHLSSANEPALDSFLKIGVIDINTKNIKGETALMMATKTGTVYSMQKLIDANSDIFTQDDNKKSLMIAALYTKNMEKINVLTKAGATIEMQGKNGLKSFVLASAAGLEDVVKNYITEFTNAIKDSIEHRKDIDYQDSSGSTALIQACRNGHIEIVKALLDVGADPDIQDRHGYTALMYAWNDCENEKNEKIVQLLIGANADIDIQDNYGNTALLGICGIPNKNENHIKIIEHLINAGADIEISNKNKLTPILSTSQVDRNTDVIKLLLKVGANIDIKDTYNKNILMYSCQLGNTKAVKLLLKLNTILKEKNKDYIGINLNDKSTDGNTALIYAIQNKYPEIAKILTEEGIDVNTIDNNGNTALILTCINNLSDTASLLIEQNANINVINKKNDTALRLASWNNHTDIVRTLLKTGKIQDKEKEDSFLLVAQKGHIEIIKLFLEYGVDINAKSISNHDTALIWATSKNHPDIVNLLIDKGSDINIQNKNGWTPLMLASKNGNVETATRLLKAGSNINIKNMDNQTSLDILRGKTNDKTIDNYDSFINIKKELIKIKKQDMIKKHTSFSQDNFVYDDINL